MADREAEPSRPGSEPVERDVEGARPVGEVPGRRPHVRETFRTGILGDLGAEFLGTFVLITFGWAMAVVFGVYVAGGITGAHINPAVTLAFAVRGDLPWRKVPGYWLGQA